MNELEFQEEWLSAYLDDELTDEQRRVVEQRLAMDPAAQATFEDLQRVRFMVAKLPSWSGPDLKIAIPNGTPGSFDEAEDELDDELANNSDELDDFEEVPRVVAGVDEPRVAFKDKSNGNGNAHSMWSLVGWGATAASILLVAGLGSLYYWPPASSEVAYDRSAPSAKVLAPSGNLEQENAKPYNFEVNDSMEKSGSEGRGLVPGGASELANSLGASADGNYGGRRLTERSDPALLRQKPQQPETDAITPQAEVPPSSSVADSKMKANSNSQADNPASSLGGFGGGIEGAPADLAMRALPSDSPTAELPPPAAMRSAGNESAETRNAPNASASMAGAAESAQYALPAAAFFYARSQSWSDVETLSRLSSATPQSRPDQLAFGNSSFQRGAVQDNSEPASESVLMAAIKPEVANSPEFFQNIVTSNRLVEVDQPPFLNQPLANVSQAGNALSENLPNNTMANNPSTISTPATGKFEAAQNNSLANQASNALPLNRFSNQRNQLAVPNQPQGNSIVLFLTRNEANQILSQLQEQGQVTSQIWTVDKQLETQSAADNRSSSRNLSQSQNAANQRAANEPSNQLNQKAESSINDRVILLLNGPPN